MGDPQVEMQAGRVGANQPIATVDLQNLRSRIGDGSPFVISDGDRHARAIGMTIQPARITPRGVVFHVKKRFADQRYMNTQSKRIEKEGKFSSVKLARSKKT